MTKLTDEEEKNTSKNEENNNKEPHVFFVTKGQKKEEDYDTSIIEGSEIEKKAAKLLRIGGIWFKKAKDPLTHQESLFQIACSSIYFDEGKEKGTLILRKAAKYLSRKNVPSHIDYHESIDNGDGDLFYNIYRPLPYTPAEGVWPNIEKLLRHIFQEQYEMGLDYIQKMYEEPLHSLPLLLLVSEETGTGKSTFCKFLNAIFGENALPLTPEIVESRFNTFWVGKLLGYIEEQADDSKDRRQQTAKVKNIVTAETLPAESKGKDPTLETNFLKIIICSNDEYTPVKIDANDTRYWVRKVPALSREEEGVDILNASKKEIPAFLHALLNRKMYHERENRLWFSPDDIHTEAWRKIVESGKSSFEASLVNLLLDTMNVYEVDELKYSKTELNNIVRLSNQFSDSDRRKTSDLKIREIMHRWGLKASEKNVRHDVYSLDVDGGPKPIENRSNQVYIISRDLLLSR